MANPLKKIVGKKEDKSGIDWELYPARLAPGLFFLNSAVGKVNVDEETAKGLQGFAGALPGTDLVDAKTFVKLVSTAEFGIAAALITPFVPNRLAGAALTAFSSGLLGMYFGTPGMTAEGSKIRPSEQGLSLIKDSWLFGLGITMMLRGNKK